MIKTKRGPYQDRRVYSSPEEWRQYETVNGKEREKPQQYFKKSVGEGRYVVVRSVENFRYEEIPDLLIISSTNTCNFAERDSVKLKSLVPSAVAAALRKFDKRFVEMKTGWEKMRACEADGKSCEAEKKKFTELTKKADANWEVLSPAKSLLPPKPKPTNPSNPGHGGGGNSGGMCRTGLDCGAFEVCVSGKCVTQGGPDNRCHSDFDCGFPQFRCVNGACSM